MRRSAAPALLFVLLTPALASADAALDAAVDAEVADLATDAVDPTSFLGHHGLVVAIDAAEGGTLYVLDLTTHELTRLSDEIACRQPQVSPDGARVVYHRAGMVYLRALAGGRATPLVAGYDGTLWLDEAGDEWLYYTTIGDDPDDTSRLVEWPDSEGITTRRRRLRDGKDEHVLDWKGSGGPSPDGTHIVAGYATVALFDSDGVPHFLNGGEQGCNTSLSPDERYLVMFLPQLDHRRIAIVDKDDQPRWELAAPADFVRWDNPDWSNHPRFAVASGVAAHGRASLVLLELPAELSSDATTRWLEVRTEGYPRHDWREAVLWVDWSPPSPDLGPQPRDAGWDSAPNADAGKKPSSGGCAVGDHGGSTLALVLIALLALVRLRSW